MARSKKKTTKRRRNAKKKVRARRPGVRGRPPKGTEDWVPEFLKAVQFGRHVTDAAIAAKIDPVTPYHRADKDPVFAEHWKQAQEIGMAALAYEAARRAYHGVERPILYKGEVVGHIKEYSDQLIMFLLRAGDPAKYAKYIKAEFTGKDGEPMKSEQTVFVLDVNSEEFKSLPVTERLRLLREQTTKLQSA